MALSPKVVDAMVAAGCSVEQLAAAVKADSLETLEREAEQRENARQRQRRSRENRKANEINNRVTVTPVTSRDTPSLSPEKKKGSPQTPLKEKNKPLSLPLDIGFSDEKPQVPDDVAEPTSGKPKPKYTATFEAFWTAWKSAGGGGGKFQAFKAWERISSDERQEATDRAGAYFMAWRAECRDASPLHGSTYLNNRRWDGMDPPAEQNGSGLQFVAEEAGNFEMLSEKYRKITGRQPQPGVMGGQRGAMLPAAWIDEPKEREHAGHG